MFIEFLEEKLVVPPVTWSIPRELLEDMCFY